MTFTSHSALYFLFFFCPILLDLCLIYFQVNAGFNLMEMLSILHCCGACYVAALLFSLAPSVTSFSRGANQASCREMVPGHIRAQPQDPQHGFVTVRTSTSSYLPGQLVTVTIRSSRDFMGFLLQARGAEHPWGRAEGSAAGVKNKSSGGHRLRATGGSGGSWTITPPSTRTLRCLSDDDTVTHSDKQLKRNLSFVWKAPDVPMGDIRFYITVVQSYFVYWAGIESEVVHDGSRRPWNNTTGVDEDKGTPTSDLTAHTRSIKETIGTFSPASTLGTPTRTKVTHPDLEINSSVTPSSTRFIIETRNPHNMDAKSSFPLSASLASAQSRGMDATTISTSPLSLFYSLVPFFPLKDVKMFRKDPRLTTDPETKDTTLNHKTSTTATPRTAHTLHNVSLTTSTSQQNPRSPKLETRSIPASQVSMVKDELQSRTSSPKPLLRFQMSTSRLQSSTSQSFLPSEASSSESRTSSLSGTLQAFLASHTTSPVDQANPPSIRPRHQPENITSSGPNSSQEQMTPSHPQLPSLQTSLHQALIERLQTKESQSEKPLESTSPQPWSLRGTKQPKSFPTLRPLTPQFDPSFRLQTKIMSQNFVLVPSTTHPPSATNLSSFTSTFQDTSTTPSPLPPTHPSGGSTPVTMGPPIIRSTLFIPSTSSSTKIQHKTAPALSALPSPSPILSPLHLPSTQPSSSLLPPSTSTIPSSSSSESQSSDPLFSVIPLSASSISFPSSPASPSPASSSSFISSIISPSSSQSTTPHPGPSPAPRRSFYNPSTSSSSPLLSQKLTVGQRLPIQNLIASSDPESIFNAPTPRTIVHRNPKPPPTDHELKSNLPNNDAKPKRPFNPSGPPDKEGKYPEIIPRHSAWELGMLLGCSAGLGMVLVVAVRYMYRQACGKRTEVTLNDREREYGRGERGLIQVQECGDLVRVRKIRENSIVLLAEYDILPSPGD
ncbi:mucin-5AC-like [Mugil cephalus]|uniref:mucin-5AC-like n=1 Tax=Mugil cephalus TaxID=48193 RepID=UPI001FB76A78|nr:mucin-5AC-like [Mugil cephalus]